MLHLSRVYNLLSAINALIVRAKTRDELYREICTIAVEQGHFVKTWIGMLPEDAELRIVALAGCSPEYEHALRGDAFRALTWRAQFHDEVVVKRRIGVINDLGADLLKVDTLRGPDFELARDAHDTGSRSVAWLPLLANGKTTAVLALNAGEVGFFNESEMRPLNELASDIGYALEHIGKSEQLEYLAYFDALTGLANATLFTERLTQHLAGGAAGKNQLAVALIDINRFTTINEAFGRQAGDDLLRLIALRLADHASTPMDVSRLSGDNFVIALVDFVDEAALARTVEETIVGAFSAPFRVQEQDVRCSIKVGLALFPSDGEDVRTLMRNAETALIRAKSGSNAYLFYDQRMSSRVAERFLLETDLRDALVQDQFVGRS